MSLLQETRKKERKKETRNKKQTPAELKGRALHWSNSQAFLLFSFLFFICDVSQKKNYILLLCL